MPGPVLFCFDGSEGSSAALAAVSELLERPVEATVLTVWQPAVVRLASAGAFAPMVLSDEGDLDTEEEAAAAASADRGATLARQHGYAASAIVRQSGASVAHTILEVADAIDARLIVCGQRGRGHMRSALLGSVSHALTSHARRPVLVAPEAHGSATT